MTRHRIGFASFSVDNLVLGLLMVEARHGYQLYQEYQATLGAIWQVGQSKFYAALDRLEADGLLTSAT
ncbi:MAG: helix-turn-helix transcriptional regulator, partial [Anaerolineae bacterium]|nr:helix-turn-helix transcriptional regulator [Anaerolineae bacterium]